MLNSVKRLRKQNKSKKQCKKRLILLGYRLKKVRRKLRRKLIKPKKLKRSLF